jgi:hypothetical protein
MAHKFIKKGDVSSHLGIEKKVTNPFKKNEDPYDLANKEVLTKENIEFCKLIYDKAYRL